jgi:predicted aspartyl protease
VIVGSIEEDGGPVVVVNVAATYWQTIIDTAFNGDLELPTTLLPLVNARFLFRTNFILAAGQTADEDLYLVDFPFDGQIYQAEATFVVRDDILVGTNLLRDHLLEVDFPAQTVRLERVN